MTVRSIDVSGWADGDTSTRAALAAEVDEACRTLGFLRLTGHGVDPALFDELLDAWQRFFDLPVEEKLRWVDPDPGNNRGYAELASERLAYSLGDEAALPDLFEGFNVGREATPDDDPDDEWRRLFSPNIWPDVPGLREVTLRYLDATAGVAATLLEIFAAALEVEPEFFHRHVTRDLVVSRALNYERRSPADEAADGQLRMGGHTDYGVLTVLLADDVPGLEVQRDGVWEPVDMPPGSLMINLGDMLARWTNDRWVSTLHRVVPPPVGSNGTARRRSFARFLEADPQRVIETIPTCITDDRPERYEPVVAGEYLMTKVLGPRTGVVVDQDRF